MEKTLILLIICLTLSCSSDKDDNPDIDVWRMIRFQSGSIVNNNFGADDIKWTFNFDTNVLTVENNVLALYPGLISSGTYPFNFENNTIAFDYITTDYNADYNLSDNDTMLTLYFDLIPLAADDEQTYSFEKY